MHVVTFYSFKGGVGRTLALVNIGVELANTGRKVLLVDFDLEAPGIDTFPALIPDFPCSGVVDYISDYLSSGAPPDFAKYHYQANCVQSGDGKLWVMPAGKRTSDYGEKLSNIDWAELYEKRSGFLLMEDLKLKWQESLNPDYVLVDSRTGHTEVGGICTRQLPDTTVVFFIPNEQNLEGVGSVVDAIKRENAENGAKINIELVASNVPSLDDEHQILRAMMRKFQNRLAEPGSARRRPPVSTINRYDSMHLLNQTIFVTERPQSRLAKQYRSLLNRIVEHNLEDREAALREITNQFPRPTGAWRDSLRATDFEPTTPANESESIKDVLRYHSNDAEINFMIGQLNKSRGDLENAAMFFSRAAELGTTSDDPNIVKYRLELLDTRINSGTSSDVEADLVEILRTARKPSELQHSISLLIRIDSKPQNSWLEFDSFAILDNHAIDAIAWLACSSRLWQEFATRLYRKRVDPDGKTGAVMADSMLAAIGAGDFDLVLEAMDYQYVMTKGEIREVFNLAMAIWGKVGEPDMALFHRVKELDSQDEPREDSNYLQCLALCSAILGDQVSAMMKLDAASHAINDFSTLTFSCWSYLRLPEPEFRADLSDMRASILQKHFKPKFIR